MIARGGRGLVGAGALASVVALPFTVYASAAFATLTVFLATIFRDPKRETGAGIVAAADGIVREADPQRGYVSTYLALRNVHVTRAPLDGVVESVVRSRGRHVPAFSKKSPQNERVEITLKTAVGTVSVIEMTGAIARRIVPYVAVGQELSKGEKMSLIRFGSRVDLHLPPASAKVLVQKGQRLRAGETTIAEVQDGRVE